MTNADTIRRSVRRHAQTAQLMGVDFLPVSLSAQSTGASPESNAAADAKPAAAFSHPDSPKAAALAKLRARYEKESVVAKQMPGWNNIVFGDGDPDARLMFVGEAPGAEEDKRGIPFVGRAGQKLNEMIKAMGLTRESVYIANILKVRPPDNRTPTPEEAELDGPFLKEQIAIIQPRVIVTLGKPAAQYLLQSRESMSSLRGRWFEFQSIPVMPTFHPAYLLRAYTDENRRKVWSDLKQAMSRLTAN